MPAEPSRPCRCEPTVEHDCKRRESRARCLRCGRVGATITWPGNFPSPDVYTAAINAFRDEHHHAD